MQVEKFPLVSSNSFESIIRDFLFRKEGVSDLINAFPDIKNFERIIQERNFDPIKRRNLHEVLTSQYLDLNEKEEVITNLQLLKEENTFTVTTGHQLCLYTGPLYFIYKIISTIRLSHQLKAAYPDKNFVPVYWMASEDHDFEEINHAFLFGKKLEWNTDQKGAVGVFKTDESIASMFDESLGQLGRDTKYSDLISAAYSKDTLSDSIRYLVNELFGDYGLIIIDGNEKKLKESFKPVLADELFHQKGFTEVNKTIDILRSRNYKIQVNPREINLFFMESGSRERLEKVNENQWKVVGTNKAFNAIELEEILNNNPEKLSPNVITRPLYQESILPNLAYIGGPGELAYWMQLKAFFEAESVQFPILVLRDSALLISQKGKQRIEKTGLNTEEIFQDKSVVLKQMLQSEETSFNNEKELLTQAFQPVIDKVTAVDASLVGAAKAELQRNINSLDMLEKKMMKALKLKEENKINQIDKLWDEIYPDGSPQERHDNFFQFASTYDGDLIADLMEHFDPLVAEMKVVYL